MSVLPTVSEEEVRRLLDPAEVVAALERAFGGEYDSFVTPVRQQIPTNDGVFLSMPCYCRSTGRLGIKFVSVVTSVQAGYMLLNPVTAQPELLIAANWLTDLRTAATSFLASKFLARREARTLGVFGTGRQARAHLEVFTRLGAFDAVLVCGSTTERTLKFADDLRRELGINAEAVDADACASRSDVTCACTTARGPLFDGNALRPGTHLNLVGAFEPDSREVDSITIRRSRVVVDTYAGALSEAGDLLIPLNEGTIRREHITAELHEIVSGSKSARGSRDEITVFKSVGCALEDLAVAELIAAKLERQAR
jgi:ornithine cyclodeaminase/alanine dehydrogenase-like protein (mu-crystallin family)